jgi:hypothetical protein
MHAYLIAYAGKQHESRIGWKAFRVLTVTTDDQRMRSMRKALDQLNATTGHGASLFLFAARHGLKASNPLAYSWHDGNGNTARLM